MAEPDADRGQLLVLRGVELEILISNGRIDQY